MTQLNSTRFDRNVPVMYNSLDLNSQEPFLFDNSSQSQTVPFVPTTPEKKEPEAVKPVTPGFNSRKLLFLSDTNQSFKAKAAAASIPTGSPASVQSQQKSQSNDQPSVSTL